MRLAPLHWFAAILLTACAGARSPVPQQSLPAARPTPQATSSQTLPLPLPPIVGIPHYVPQLGHSGEITSLAWNHDGRLIATASKEEGVKLWAMPQGAVVAELHTQATDPSDLAFGPEGHSLAVANWSGALEFWDLDELRPRATHRDHQGSVQSVAYSPDGGLLLSGGEDGTIYVYETRAQKLRGRITGMPAAVYAMAFSPDGKRLACSAGSKVQIRESGTWRPLHALEAHVKPVTSVAWSPDSLSVATGGEDGLVVVWDAQKGSASRKIESRQGVKALAWSGDGNAIAAATEDRSVGLWRAADGVVLHQWRCPRCSASAVSFNPSAQSVSFAGLELALLETTSGRIVSSVERASIQVARWQPGGERLVLDHTAKRLIELEVDSLSASVARWWSPDSLTFRWSGDGSRVALWDKDGTLRVADTRDGKTIASRKLEDFGIPRMESSPRGDPVASLPELALSPDGKQLALFDANAGLRLWQVGGAAAQRLSESTVDLAAWSPDGSLLAFFDDSWRKGESKSLRLWSVSKSRQLGRLPIQTEPGDIEFRPDGKQIAAAARDTGRIHIWDVTTLREQLTLEGPVGAEALTYSPDGRWLAAASSRSGARVWNAETGKLQQSLDRAISGVSWHRGSKVLALSGELPMLLRVDDGESLWIEMAGDNPVAFVFAADGLHDGTPSASINARFRVGRGAVDSAMIPPSQLPDTYRHAGLLRDFIEGRPMPHPQAGVAAQPH